MIIAKTSCLFSSIYTKAPQCTHHEVYGPRRVGVVLNHLLVSPRFAYFYFSQNLKFHYINGMYEKPRIHLKF